MEKDTNYFELDNSLDHERILAVTKALSMPIRLKMLQLMNEKPRTLSELCRILDLQFSSCAFHLGILEDAKVVNIEYSTKGKKTIKWYSYQKNKEIVIGLRKPYNDIEKNIATYAVSVGDFINAKLSHSCGMASDTELITDSDPNLIFLPKRKEAQIIWSREACFLEYAFPNDLSAKGHEIEEIVISFEICAETNGYNNDYPSDITLSLNGKELCVYTSPGDFGDRYGKLTPSWWYPESTKYGQMVVCSVKKSEVLLNGKSVNKNIGLPDIINCAYNKNVFRLEVKPTAKHVGGINLFGEKFGDYNQGILFTVIYK